MVHLVYFYIHNVYIQKSIKLVTTLENVWFTIMFVRLFYLFLHLPIRKVLNKLKCNDLLQRPNKVNFVVSETPTPAKKMRGQLKNVKNVNVY